MDEDQFRKFCEKTKPGSSKEMSKKQKIFSSEDQESLNPKKNILICDTCKQSFDSIYDLEKHLKTHQEDERNRCVHCKKIFSSYSNRMKHERKLHGSSFNLQKNQSQKNLVSLVKRKVSQKRCNICEREIQGSLLYHYKHEHEETDFFKYESSFKRKVLVLRKIISNKETNECQEESDSHAKDKVFQNKCLKKEITSELIKRVMDLGQIRFRIIIGVLFKKFENDSSVESEVHYIPSKFAELNLSKISKIEDIIAKMFSEIQELVQNVFLIGSGWVLYSILFTDLSIYKHYTPSIGYVNSYEVFPKDKINKRKFNSLVMNFKFPENFTKCFLYAVAFPLYSAYVSNSYDYNEFTPFIEENFNIDNIEFPIDFDGITKFCEQNSSLNLKISLINFKENEFFIAGIFGEGKQVIPILIYDVEQFDGICHGVYVRNLDGLLRVRHKSENNTEFYYNEFFCAICLNKFSSKKIRNEHELYCNCNEIQEKQQLEFLPQGDKIKFKKKYAQVLSPLIAFADFESILIKRDKTLCEICSVMHSCPHKKSMKTAKHEMIGFSLIVIDNEKRIVFSRTYAGKNCLQKFLDILEEGKVFLKKLLQTYKNLEDVLEPEWENLKKNAEFCFFCKENFKHEKEKVIDHDHYTGSFVCISCVSCNVNRQNRTVKLCFLNGGAYDFNLFLNALSSDQSINLKLSRVISKNTMKLRTFTYEGFWVFTDTLDFLNGSLEKLATTLPENHDFKILKQHPLITSEKRLKMCTGKLHFPYDFFDNEGKLKRTKIPEHVHFNNSITGKNISEKEYAKFKEMYEEMNFSNFGQLVRFYNELDVILLCEVFQLFREKCFNAFKLDISHFISLPSYAYETFLFTTGATLDAFHNEEMYRWAQKSIRGGFCFSALRHCEGNNSSSENSGKFIKGFDFNSLYPTSMLLNIAQENYEWMSEEEINEMFLKLNTNPNEIDENGKIGYFLEVDTEYDESLHEDHDQLPYLVEKRLISPEMISDYQKELIEKNNSKSVFKSEKLISHLGPRYNYVASIRILKQAVIAGVKITKIHKGMKFNQSDFLGKFIVKLLEMRKNANTKFEKDVYKVMSNSIFGKLITRAEKFQECKIITSDLQLKRCFSNPNLKDFSIVNENLILAFFQKRKILVDQPLLAGSSILENSKFIFFQTFHQIFKEEFGKSLEICVSDTDSYYISFKTENLKQNMENLSGILDFSNLDKSNPLYSEENKNAPFFMKDETAGKSIKKIVICSVKSYSVEFHDGFQDKKCAKGTPKNIINNVLKPEDYEKVIYEEKSLSLPFNKINTDRFSRDLNSYSIYKVALNPCETKRYILSCGKHSYAYFNKKIKETGSFCEKCNI